MSNHTDQTQADQQSDSHVHALDAVSYLVSDHNEVKRLFKEFEALSADSTTEAIEKKRLAVAICDFLDVHTDIEEEVFYPKIGPAIDEVDMINEALVEHEAAKDLMAKIRTMSPDEELFDANVKVLCEQVEHHVDEEEAEMFPKVRKTDLDLKALGQEMANRRTEIRAQKNVTTAH